MNTQKKQLSARLMHFFLYDNRTVRLSFGDVDTIYDTIMKIIPEYDKKIQVLYEPMENKRKEHKHTCDQMRRKSKLF